MTLISVGLHCLKKRKTHSNYHLLWPAGVSQSVRTIPLIIPGYNKPSICPACVFMWVCIKYILVVVDWCICVWLPIVMNVRIGFYSSEQLGDCLFPPIWIPDVKVHSGFLNRHSSWSKFIHVSCGTDGARYEYRCVCRPCDCSIFTWTSFALFVCCRYYNIVM